MKTIFRQREVKMSTVLEEFVEPYRRELDDTEEASVNC
jgi:hypothetical protein